LRAREVDKFEQEEKKSSFSYPHAIERMHERGTNENEVTSKEGAL